MKSAPKIHCLLLSLLLFAIHTYGQAEKGRPYFSMAGYVLDDRSSANHLQMNSDQVIGLVSLGGGYEFRIKDSWSFSTGADLSIGAFDDDYYDLSDPLFKLATMRINVTGLAINIIPRHNIFDLNGDAIFIEGVGKLETFGSKAHFEFREKDDFSSERTTSGFHFYTGFNLGCSLHIDSYKTVHLSLGVITHDFGKSVNKLDLEQSGYFKNEHLKKRTSLVLRMIFDINVYHQREHDSSGFNSIFSMR